MTTIWKTLEDRGLDVERLVLKGWSVEQGRDAGERLSIPFARDGQVMGQKFRSFSNPDHKWFAKWVVGPIAYNEDCLRDPSLCDQPLIITEGEMDCESALLAGFHRVLSVPNGCGGTSHERSPADIQQAKAYEWFRQIAPLVGKDRVEHVILATDGDEAGNALMHELAVLFGKFRCKFLTYPRTRRTELGRERCKDLNEVLIEYGAKGVVETVARAKFIRVEGVYKMSELAPLPLDEIYEIGFAELGKNMKIRMGDLMVVTGVPGFGKSTLVNDICCRVAHNYGLKIAWGSFEQSPQTDHRRNLRTWFMEQRERELDAYQKAQADEWIDKHHCFIVPADDDDPTLEWLIDCMEAAVVQHGVKVIVVDPWNELEHVRDSRESETEYIGRAIRTLKRFAAKFRIHLIVVAHPAKLQKVNGKYLMPSLYDISGSANWYNKADLGVIVHREDADSTTIKVQKVRYHGVIGCPGEMKLGFSPADNRYREEERLA